MKFNSPGDSMKKIFFLDFENLKIKGKLKLLVFY